MSRKETPRYASHAERVNSFLRHYFCHVNFLTTAKAMQLLCSKPVFECQVPTSLCSPFRFSVTFGWQQFGGFRISWHTFDSWLERLEVEPVILLHYANDNAEGCCPDYFLVLYSWVIANLQKIQESSNTKSDIHIKYADFDRVKTLIDQSLVRTLANEAGRTCPNPQGVFATHREHFPDEYSYIRFFPQIVQLWELPLLQSCEIGFANRIRQARSAMKKGREFEGFDKLLNRLRSNHPMARCAPRRLENEKQSMYLALRRFEAGQNFRLGRRFSVITNGVARAMASKYPGFLGPISYLFKNWHKRGDEVLTALIMAGAMSHFDMRTRGEVVQLLKTLEKEVDAVQMGSPTAFAIKFSQEGTKGLWKYRLIHHVNYSLAEVTGEQRYTQKALDIAAKNSLSQIKHLMEYGWGFGQHAVTWYEDAARDPTARGQKLRDYNNRMATLVREFLI